jgi:hypothetical protein
MASIANMGNPNDDQMLNAIIQLVRDKHVRLMSVQINTPFIDPDPWQLKFASFPDWPEFTVQFVAITDYGQKQLTKIINLQTLKVNP